MEVSRQGQSQWIRRDISIRFGVKPGNSALAWWRTRETALELAHIGGDDVHPSSDGLLGRSPLAPGQLFLSNRMPRVTPP
jgi:hypothetical protein